MFSIIFRSWHASCNTKTIFYPGVDMSRPVYDKDATMNHKLNWIAVLLAGLLATSNAAADNAATRQGNDSAREEARVATEAAARQSAEAVREANRLDLDIRLIGPTSKKIAGDR